MCWLLSSTMWKFVYFFISNNEKYIFRRIHKHYRYGPCPNNESADPPLQKWPSWHKRCAMSLKKWWTQNCMSHFVALGATGAQTRPNDALKIQNVFKSGQNLQGRLKLNWRWFIARMTFFCVIFSLWDMIDFVFFFLQDLTEI